MATTTPEQELGWEKRFGPYAAGAAIASAVLSFVPPFYLGQAVEGPLDRDDKVLVAVDREAFDFFLPAALQSLALLLLIPVFLYLYRAERFRIPAVPTALKVLAVLGPVLASLVPIAFQINLSDVATDFVASGGGGEDRAKDFIRDNRLPGEAIVAASLALGLAFVLASRYAIRAGLMSRFMGYLGVIIGLLLIITQLFSPGSSGSSFLQTFWLGALGALFLGRWPNGRGKAWETGEATPWPTASEARIAAKRAQREAAGEPEADEPGAEPEAQRHSEPDESRARTPRKRKRKRR